MIFAPPPAAGEKEVDEIKEEVSSSVDKLLAEQLQTDTAPLKDGTSTQNKVSIEGLYVLEK